MFEFYTSTLVLYIIQYYLNHIFLEIYIINILKCNIKYSMYSNESNKIRHEFAYTYTLVIFDELNCSHEKCLKDIET